MIPTKITHYKKGSTKIKVIEVENVAGCPIASVTTLSKIMYDTRFFWGVMSAFLGIIVCLTGTYYFKRTVLASSGTMTFIVLCDTLFYQVESLRKYPTNQTVWVALLLCAFLSMIMILIVRLTKRLQMAILGFVCGLCFFNGISVLIPTTGVFVISLVISPLTSSIFIYFLNENFAKLLNQRVARPTQVLRVQNSTI